MLVALVVVMTEGAGPVPTEGIAELTGTVVTETIGMVTLPEEGTGYVVEPYVITVGAGQY